MSYILERLREPSSYAGLAALIGLFGIKVAPEAWTLGVEALTALAALAAFLMKDRAE